MRKGGGLCPFVPGQVEQRFRLERVSTSLDMNGVVRVLQLVVSLHSG
jgi:hypothetical protein